MRIAMPVYAFYETDTRVIRYAEALAARGDDVVVYSLRRPGQPGKAVINNVKVHRLQKRNVSESGRFGYLAKLLLFFIRCFVQLSTQHLIRNFDVIHVHNIPDFLVFCALVPKLGGAKVILDIHDILPEFYCSKFGASQHSLMFKSLLLVEKLSAGFADHVIAANHIWGERLAKRAVAAKHCSVYLNDPDLQVYHERPDIPKNGKFKMIYPGTLNEHQGVDLAVEAFAVAERQMPNAVLHIYGDGPARDNLERLAAEKGLQNKIEVQGWQDMNTIAERIAAADAGVVPKRAEGFGDEAFSTKILEFMASAVPVIVSKTRIDSYYFDNKQVLFFSSGDAHDLAQKMITLYNDSELRKALIKNGREYIKAHNWDLKKKEYLALIDKLAGGEFRQ